jgi:hypothetical protein
MQHRLPYRFYRQLDPMPLMQLLARERGTDVGVMAPINAIACASTSGTMDRFDERPRFLLSKPWTPSSCRGA